VFGVREKLLYPVVLLLFPQLPQELHVRVHLRVIYGIEGGLSHRSQHIILFINYLPIRGASPQRGYVVLVIVIEFTWNTLKEFIILYILLM
jgi:hypothetical protein